MSDLPFDSFDDFRAADDSPDDPDVARSIWDTLVAEARDAVGDAVALWQSIRDNGPEVVERAGIDILSPVQDPAIHSDWLLLRSDGTTVETVDLLVRDDDAEEQLAFAPAMIPIEPAKDGQIVPTHVVRAAAHDFNVNADPDAVDQDHDLFTGKGEVVESWTLKEPETWETAEGGERDLPAGTWMVGIRFEDEPWERIKDGDLTGISVFGQKRSVLARGSATLTDLWNELHRRFPEDAPIPDDIDSMEACEAWVTEHMPDIDDPGAFCAFHHLDMEVRSGGPETVSNEPANQSRMVDAEDLLTDDALERDLGVEELASVLAALTDKDAADLTPHVETMVESETEPEPEPEPEPDEVEALRNEVEELREDVTAAIEPEEEVEGDEVEQALAQLADALDAEVSELRDLLQLSRSSEEEEPPTEVAHRGTDGEATREAMIMERQEPGTPAGLSAISYQEAADNWGEDA